jgi:uncharacterized protein (TIGR03089 family)
MSPAPTTVTDLVDLLAARGGQPALTWYGDDGERIELSGAVVGNWVAKTVNLLVEEFDAEPGTAVLVDLPVGWRQAVWALAAARCGAVPTLLDPTVDAAVDPVDGGCEVVVTSRPAAWEGTSAELVAVALPALARTFDGELPPGAVDAARAVMSYGDAIGWDPAASSPTSLEVLSPPAGTAVVPGARTIVPGDRPVATVLADLVAVWSADGSAVLTSAATAAGLRADEARLDRLREAERVTV